MTHVERLETQLQETMSTSQPSERSTLPTMPTPPSGSDSKELAVVREKVVELDRRLAEVLQERDGLQERLQKKVGKGGLVEQIFKLRMCYGVSHTFRFSSLSGE